MQSPFRKVSFMHINRFTLIYLLCVPPAIVVTQIVSGFAPPPSIGLPVDPTDLDFSGETYGIWPYGVKGNISAGHLEGHPGIDFSWNHSGEVYAVGDGYIAEITVNDRNQNVVIQRSATNVFVDFEYAMGNLTPATTLGAFVRRGDLLGNASVIVIPREPTPYIIYMIHFGVHRSSVLTWQIESPEPYFDADARAKIGSSIWDNGTVMNKSTYGERLAFPYLTNSVGADFAALYIKIPSEIGWAIIGLAAVGYLLPVIVVKRRNSRKQSGEVKAT